MSQNVKLGWRGGVNLLLEPHSIRDDQLALAKNCWPLVNGQLATREPVKFERQVGAGARNILALFVPDPSTGFVFVCHYVDSAGDQWIEASAYSAGASIVALKVATGAVNGYQPMVFANYRGEVLAVGAGNEGVFHLMNLPTGWAWVRATFQWDDVVTVTGKQTQITGGPVKPTACCTYKDRMVYAVGNSIIFADRAAWSLSESSLTGDLHQRAPIFTQIGNDALADNGRRVTFSSIQGETITAMEEFSLNSVTDPLQTGLLVHTSGGSTLMIQGEVSETTDSGTTFDSYLGNLNYPKVNMTCGIAGAYAKCRGPNGMFWADENDVYAIYDSSAMPVKIGTNIRPALQACPPSLRKFWYMTYANGAVFLSIPYAVLGTSGYSWYGQHWRLDLRPPAEDSQSGFIAPQTAAQASWWGPMDYSSIYGLNSAIVSIDDVVYALATTLIGVLYEGTAVVTFNKGSGAIDSTHNSAVSAPVWRRVASGDPAEDKYVVALAGKIGSIVEPTAVARTGRLYELTGGDGQSDSTELAWPTTDGGIVADGGAEWTEICGISEYVPDSTYNGTCQPNVMQVDFKDLTLGDLMRDKVFQRMDLAAYAPTKQHIYAEVDGDQGDRVFYAGIGIIGHSDNSGNDLGELILDSARLASAYQTRCLRPTTLTVDDMDPSVRLSYENAAPGVIRGRALQPKFRPGSAFVIDDTNDYLCMGSVFSGVVDVQQVQIPHAVYQTLAQLLLAITTAINDYYGLFSANGCGNFNTPSVITNDPSSLSGSYGPYMVGFNFQFSERNDFAYMALMGASSDATVASTTYYLSRSLQLMAMLGFDTTDAWPVAQGLDPTLFTWGGVQVVVNGQNTHNDGGITSTNPTDNAIWGSRVIVPSNPAVMVIADASVDLRMLPGRGLSKRGTLR